MNFTCVRVCGVEGRGKSLSGQLFFVCEKDDRGESSTKSLGGMTRPKDEMGSQTVSSESEYLIRYQFIEVGTTTPKLRPDAFQLWRLRSLNFQSFSDPSEIRWRVRGAREAPVPRDSLKFRRACLLSRNEFESGTFTIVLHETSSFTHVSIIYGANSPAEWKKKGRSTKIVSDFLIFAFQSNNLSKFSDDFTPFFGLWKTITKSPGKN